MSDSGPSRPPSRPTAYAHIADEAARCLFERMSLRTIVIREYRIGDAGAMAEVYYHAVRELGSRRYSPEQVEAWAPEIPDAARFASRAGDGRLTLVAVDGSAEVVAFGDLEPNGHIDLLYCRPDVSGTGVATQLLDALLDRAASALISRLSWRQVS